MTLKKFIRHCLNILCLFWSIELFFYSSQPDHNAKGFIMLLFALVIATDSK